MENETGTGRSGSQQDRLCGMTPRMQTAGVPGIGPAGTPLAESNAFLLALVEHASESMHSVDPSGRITWTNQAALNLLGYSSNEYVGHQMCEFHADQSGFDTLWEKLQHGDDVPATPARLRCKNGDLKHVLIHGRGHFFNGRLQCVHCFTHDVTERDVLRLQDATAKLAQLERRNDEFLAMLGHELRNPLAPIVSSLALMQLLEPDMAAFRRARMIVERQVALLARLVDDLLDASRLTQGTLEVRPEASTLGPVLDLAVELARPLIDNARHRLVVEAPDAATPLYGDTTRLAQALANLLNNAAQYTACGGSIQLTVRLMAGGMRFSVQDNGSGLTPALLEKAFDLFVQGENRAQYGSGQRGGLGVGLALTRAIIELHGGHVTATSAGPGTGSEFIVWLPQGSFGRTR